MNRKCPALVTGLRFWLTEATSGFNGGYLVSECDTRDMIAAEQQRVGV